MRWDPWVSSFNHFFVEACHIISTERGFQRNRFVEHAPEWPDIWLAIVRLIFPHLWRGIIRCACLSVEKSLLGDFTNIHVSEFGCTISIKENICWLEIPMQNLSIMKWLETLNYLNKNAPNFLFLQVGLFLLMLGDFLVQIAMICILHHNTEKD